MGYSEVKTKINNQIKTNGNQEITGAILNDVLNDVLDYSHDGGGVSVSQNTSTGHTEINIGGTANPVASTNDIFDKVFLTRKNLFNVSKGVQNAYIDSAGNIQSSTSFNISELIPVEPNTTYHLSCNDTNWSEVGNVNVKGWFYKADGTKTLFATDTTTVQTPANCYAIQFSYVKAKKEIQLEKGSQRTSYQPFVAGEFYSLFDGVSKKSISSYFDKVFVTRKNLFNVSAAETGYYIDSTGQKQASASFGISEIIPVIPGSTYHLSAQNDDAVGNVNSYGWFYKADGTAELFNTGATSISVPNDCYSLCFSYIVSKNEKQFEIGNQRTAYESFITGSFPLLIDEYMWNYLSTGFFNNPFEEFLYTPKSLNLCGGYNCVHGYYVNGSGQLVASTGWKTYIIPVSPGKTYQLFPSGVTPGNDIYAVKDINGNVLANGSNIGSITTPANSKWLYYSLPKEAFYAQVTEGNSPIAYISGDIFTNGKIDYDYDAVLPRRLFVIEAEQNSIYHSEYCRTYNDNNVYADKDGGIWDFGKRYWRIEAANTTNGNLSFHLRDRRTDEVLKSFSVPVCLGSKNKTSTNKKINVIGDSFCYGGHYLKQIADCCGNTTFVGMREAQRYNLKCEGRGGWTLAQYFNPKSTDIALTHMQPFSPFMHASGYNYYGVIEFWAAIVNNTSQYAYGTDGFGDYKSWFDTTGRKKTPSANDLMYNQTAGYYEYWDGSSWVQLDSDPTFEFNYAKYLEIWQIDTPDFVVIQLGTNDFYAGDADFDLWFERMDAVIASINACASTAGKTINILLCTVLTASGTPNNTYKDGVIKRNKYYYEARKQVINRYDPSTVQANDHVHVVDTGISVDDEYGFLTEERLPFAYYEGTAREIFDINGVHPNVGGYKQFANPIAGAIQYCR